MDLFSSKMSISRRFVGVVGATRGNIVSFGMYGWLVRPSREFTTLRGEDPWGLTEILESRDMSGMRHRIDFPGRPLGSGRLDSQGSVAREWFDFMD